jgi:tetratricopeptide (TPR) repeat protein
MEKTHRNETVNGKVKLQNLRDFTVQIRHSESDEIVGTGIAISQGGKIVTCNHVAASAGIVLPEEIETGEVGVYFPRARGGEEKNRRAKIAAYFPKSDDDVVLLQLIGKPPPLAPEQIAVLSDAERSEFNPFRSYGYRDLDNFIGGWADGKIMSSVDPPEGSTLLIDPIQLDSKQINHGMSGAAALDTKRNVVVGIISMTYFADRFGKDRDTAWAVDAKVLTFDPLKIPLYAGESLELKASEKPTKEVMEEAQAVVGRNLSLTEYPAPAPPTEWVGRQDLLAQLNRDWENTATQITGLIGFGGEGKSSLASRWIHELLKNKQLKQSDGLFWWSFYDRRSMEEFFEAALTYLSGDNQELLQQAKSPNARAHLIAGMLYSGSYLFVLDGLEVMQHQEGDRYGEFISEDLQQFLEYFSAPGHTSFCLITSRAPLFDLIEYNSYIHRDVTRLTENEGKELLRKVGVKGPESELKKAVNLWDGHALTLGLIGSYLAEAHHGDITHLDDIEPPTAGEPRYERVHRILRRYDEHLSETERVFLQLFSAFRTPVEESAFEKVFRTKTTEKALNAPVAALSDTEFKALLNRLQTYRILRYSPREKHYTTHPLIRAHYLTLLSQRDRSQTQKTHQEIKNYYLSKAKRLSHYPTLEDLNPVIEVVHHTCQAGAYEEAYHVWQKQIYRDRHKILIHQLGASSSCIELLHEFFPDGDLSREPQVTNLNYKRSILQEVGLRLMDLGHLTECEQFYNRSLSVALKTGEKEHISRIYQDLSDLFVHLGMFEASGQAANNALKFSREVESKWEERYSLCRQAWVAHLDGNLAIATSLFQQAETIEQIINPNRRYLFSTRGTQHAEHLRRIGQIEYAQLVTRTNLDICRRNKWVRSTSKCYRVLGDLMVDNDDYEQTRKYYDAAIRVARNTSLLHILIEALLARGRWLARQPARGSQPLQGFSDINEALGYALQGGYRIYEVDIRVALSWWHRGAGNLPAATTETQRALTLSEEMGYYWGKKDAEEVLAALGEK